MSDITPPTFEATPPPIEADPVPPQFIARKSEDDGSTEIGNAFFFPSVKLRDFQQRYNEDSGTREERQINALISAMQSVNDELLNPNSMESGVSWVDTQIQRGFCKLTDVPSLVYRDEHQPKGCSAKVHQYFTAIYAHAKSLLMERVNDNDPRSRHLDQADDLDVTADDYLQESREAIRKLMDKPRCTIELL